MSGTSATTKSFYNVNTCSPTLLADQHIRVPYSRVRVGVKVRTLLVPLDRMYRLLTVLASAELLKVHLLRKQEVF
jgi:hypothetical protein